MLLKLIIDKNVLHGMKYTLNIFWWDELSETFFWKEIDGSVDSSWDANDF